MNYLFKQRAKLVDKIIVHGGIHHADELSSIAFFESFYGEKEVIRTFNIKPFVEANRKGEINYLILDISGIYEPENLIIDHHQDGELEATNVLLLNLLMEDGREKELILEHLFQEISDIDRGLIKDLQVKGSSFNGIIRSLNSVENGFEKALTVARITVNALLAVVKETIEGEEYFKTLQKEDGIVFEYNSKHIPNWKELARKERIYCMICPNARGGWQITSFDSNVFRIDNIGVENGQTFCHANGFIAVYKTKEQAINHAKELIKDFKHQNHE